MKKIKYLFLIVFFLIATPTFASTCGVTSSGGTRNWNTASTWFNCAGSFPAAGDDVIATSTSGNVIVNVNTAALKSFDFSTYGGTLSGTSQIIVRGLSASTQDIKFGGTVTWTGQLNLQNNSTSALLRLTTNGKLLSSITNSAASVATTTLQDNLSFSALTTNVLTLGAAPLDMNGFNLSGNSATNRILITSNAMGTVRTITPNGGTFANADFRDMATNVSTNLASITGNSGDCGGNSNITFTTPAAQTWSGTASDSWSTNAWSGRVPLCQDDVSIASAFTPAGRTITVDMPRLGANINFTGTTGGVALTPTAGLTSSIYGSLTLVSTMSIANVNGTFQFEGRGSYTVTSAGNTFFPQVIINAYGGTIQTQDASIFGRSLTLTQGTFDANIYNVTIGTALSVANSSSVILGLGTGTWTFTGTGTVVSVLGTNAIIVPSTSTIVISNNTSTAKTFAGGGETFYDVSFSGDNIIVTGANTFHNLGIDNAGDTNTTGLILSSGTATTTITSLSTNATTTADRAILFAGALAGLQANTGGNICVDYLSIQNIRAYGTSAFYAGANSLDVGGNIGWNFTACPAPVTTTQEDSDMEFY